MSVDLNKDLTGMNKDAISQYLGEVEFYIDTLEDRLDTLDDRKARIDKMLVDLALSKKKQSHIIATWKRYYEKTKRAFFRKDY